MKMEPPTHTLLKRFDVDLERIRCTYFNKYKGLPQYLAVRQLQYNREPTIKDDRTN